MLGTKSPAFASGHLSRRGLIRSSLALGALALLSACGGPSSVTATTQPAVTTASALNRATTATASSAATTAVPAPTATPAPTVVTSSVTSSTTTAASKSATSSGTAAATGARSAISAYYLTTGNKEQDSLWPGFFAKFSEEHPSITVEASGTPGAPTMLQKLTPLIAGGTPPDWAWDGGSDVAPLGYKGALLDLGPYLARDKVQADAFWPGGWTMSTVRGKRLAVPVNIDPQMLFFDKNLFQTAGIPTPLELQGAKSWDWQHFRDAAAKLTKRPPGTTGVAPLADIYGFELPTVVLPWELPWLRTWGGEILNADLTQPTLNSPGMIAGVEALVALSVQDRSAFVPGIPKAPGFIDMEKAGREAMVWAWDSRVAIWRDVHYDWDVIGVVPTATNGPQSLLGGNPEFLFAGAKNKDAAWTLAHWCVTPAPNLQIGIGYGSVPSLRANLPAFKATLLKQGKPANLNAYDEALQVAQPQPATPAFNDLQTAWGKAMVPVWLGQAEPKTVLASLTPQFTAALAKYA